MDLKTFVSDSLQQIIAGVEDAQAKCAESIINSTFQKTRQENVTVVEFDIAVTIEKGTETKGGIAVLSGIVSLGSQGQSSAGNTSVSRIQFSVPIAFKQVTTAPNITKIER